MEDYTSKQYTSLNQDLLEAREKADRYQKLCSMAERLERDLEKSLDEELKLDLQLDKEKADVENLEKLSLASLFYTILRNKEEQLEKERQEELSAHMRLQNMREHIISIKKDLAEIKMQCRDLEAFPIKYQEFLEQKRNLLLQQYGEQGDRLLVLERDYENLLSNRKEIIEAIEAGENLITKINAVVHSLNSAGSWGTWDMLGGGFFSTMAKHSHIDDAKQMAAIVQHQIDAFQAELADISISERIDINIDNFDRFMDYFFDGLIADWLVQNKIEASKESVLRLQRQVKDIVNQLYDLKDKNCRDIEEKSQQVTAFIEGCV